MLSIAWMFDRLIEAAAISLVLFTLGSLAALCCRQPVRRIRVIILTLAASVLAPLLNFLPGLPHWRLLEIKSNAATDLADREEPLPSVDARVPTADSRSTSRMSVAVADAAVELAGATGEGETALQNQEASLEPAPFVAASIPAAERVSPRAAAPLEQPASTRTIIASLSQNIDRARWIVGSYLAGAALLATWWVLGFAGLRRMLRTARPAPEFCETLLREIAGPAGDHVRLLSSPRAPQPFTFGWFRPVIMLPEQMTSLIASSPDSHPGAFSTELKWSLAHEWLHVARGDVRAWSFAGLVRLVYFYQPLCWWLRRELRLCQDYLADAAAAQGSSPEIYAEFLTARGLGRPLAVGLGIAGGKSDLYRRIVMLVQNRRSLETRCPRGWTAAAATSAFALVVLAATCGGKHAALAAADHPARSGTRESSDVRQATSLKPNDRTVPNENAAANRDGLAFRDASDTVDQSEGTAEVVAQPDTDEPGGAAKSDLKPEALQKLLNGIFERAAAVRSGRFETTVVRTRDGNATASRRRFVVSGESWSRTGVPNPPNPFYGSADDQLEVVRAGHRFTLAQPAHSGPPSMAAPTRQPVTLTINWPDSAKSDNDSCASPPIQAGTVWYRSTVPYLRDHYADAQLRGTSRVNECDTQIIEWVVPANASKTAFVNVSNLLSLGGIYRVYVSEKLGFALAKIEYIDRFGTPQLEVNFLEFQERAPGIYLPKYVRIQEADEIWRLEINEAANLNESIDDREFILKIPPRTLVRDNRYHRGEQRGIGDARTYPLRSFTTGAEYPDGLPAAMLEEMDRDAVTPEELRAFQTNASKEPTDKSVKPKAEALRVTATKKIAEQIEVDQAVEKTVANSRTAAQNNEAKKRLLYGGKSFQEWRSVLHTELEPASRIKALQAIGELGANGYADEAAAAIAELLRNGTGPVQRVYSQACSALERLGTAGIPLLESEIQRDDQVLRHIALGSLAQLAAKTDAVFPALHKAAGDADAKIRASACAALAQHFLAAPGVAETLIAALKNDDTNVRSNILEAIWRIKSTSDKEFELLKLLLHDDDDQIRGKAAYLFGTRVPPSRENTALLGRALLNSTPDCVRVFLNRLTQQPTVSSRAVAEMVVPSLVAIIETSDSDPDVGIRAVELSLRALNGMTREQATLAAIPVSIKGMRGELAADSEGIRGLCAETLGRFGPAAKEALPALKELAESGWERNNSGETRSRIRAAIRSIEANEK